MRTKYLKVPIKLKDFGEGIPEGSIQAMFSVFNTIDQSSEVVLPSFFADGQEIPMVGWGHNWYDLPVGKGVIRLTQEGAVFDGRFFLETERGREHYETIKAMGSLQEYSFGFRVLEERQGQFEGKDVTFLVRGETYEASPVLIGDNRMTHTLGIKGSRSPEDTIAAIKQGLDQMTDALKADFKEGRAISTQRRTQMGEIGAQLRGAADALDAILEETAPKKEVDPEVVRRELLRYERFRSSLVGIN